MKRGCDTAITLSEEDGVRYLHFGSPWVQGAMRIARPFALEIDYVRDMMAWLLFLAPPAHILQLGLGAAALTKYCWRRFPGSAVTAVERSPAVIASARRDFALPADDARLRVVCADAGEFVARASGRGRYGVVQVDLYDRQARGPVIDSLAFYRRCRSVLATSGVLVVNLFGEHDSYLRSTERIGEAFGGRLLALPPVPAGNVVLLAFKGPPMQVDWQVLRRRARELDRVGLPARAWFEALRGQQGRFARSRP
ncbi:MAG: spermidine synthase [Burkholderiaceae bacterium]|nr:spermidine synthase [Burkholderiaceae bacterium]